jgi:hypothetical protein
VLVRDCEANDIVREHQVLSVAVVLSLQVSSFSRLYQTAELYQLKHVVANSCDQFSGL